MSSYRLVTYRAAEGPRAGVVVGEAVYDAAALTGRPGWISLLHLLDDWAAAQERLQSGATEASQGRHQGRPLAQVERLAPVLWPSAIYCAGANYRDHMLEMAKVQNIAPEPDPHDLGLSPWHFIKASRSVVADQAVVALPAYSKMVDWEAELTAVIGRPARNVPIERALEHVAGYTIANDLSARDHTVRAKVPPASPFRFDWLSQKCFDGACPVGPWIVPAHDIPDPQNLAIKLWVNDVLKQDSHTSGMIFTLAEQIAHLSTRMTLHPGDLICTGTPAGVGLARKEFLKPGDVVKITIESVGTLTNRFV